MEHELITTFDSDSITRGPYLAFSVPAYAEKQIANDARFCEINSNFAKRTVPGEFCWGPASVENYATTHHKIFPLPLR